MKAILISIRPQWVELILNLIKKDEIRKGTAIGKAINRLIKEQGVAPMLIYCTKGNTGLYDNHNHLTSYPDKYFLDSFGYDKPPLLNGKVVARFNATAEEINHTYLVNARSYSIKSCLTAHQFSKECCLEQWELDQYLKGKNGTAIHINDLEIFDKPKELSEFKSYKRFDCYNADFDYTTIEYREIRLTKAPQSWCWIEV